MSGDSGLKLKPSGMRVPMDHRRVRNHFEHEVYYITAVVKTTEFETRLNLPSYAASYIGEEDCMLNLYVGRDKKDVVEFMELAQGDFIEFRSCLCDRRRFYVAKKLHDALIEVKEEEFYGELYEVSD
ncbi:hypothetical protein C2S51_027689 [Perilla frutescens var. frutescens]|nr:hypothetical protein C2S51_027689 [Perilla frutescens var. frutescens]